MGDLPLHHHRYRSGRAGDPAVVARPLPVAVGNLGHDLAALLDRLEDGADVEGAAECSFDADLDVVEIDENGEFQSLI